MSANIKITISSNPWLSAKIVAQTQWPGSLTRHIDGLWKLGDFILILWQLAFSGFADGKDMNRALCGTWSKDRREGHTRLRGQHNQDSQARMSPVVEESSGLIWWGYPVVWPFLWHVHSSLWNYHNQLWKPWGLSSDWINQQPSLNL